MFDPKEGEVEETTQQDAEQTEQTSDATTDAAEETNAPGEFEG